MKVARTGYIAAIVGSAVGANKNHIGLFNAVGSGLVLHVRKVMITSHLTANNTGAATSFVVARTTAAGTGAAQAVRQRDLLSPALPAEVTALGVYSVQPTVAANSEVASIPVFTEEAGSQTPSVPAWEGEPIVVRQGGGIVIQQTALAGAGAIAGFIHFDASYEGGN